MAQFTYGQLESLWIQAGGSKVLAPLMAAIALAESGGNSDARNPSGASGLWQILGQPFPGNVFDPKENARMAVAKEKEQGLGAWETYTSGAYKQFLRGNVPPAQAQTTAAAGGGDSTGLWQWGMLIPGFAAPLSIMAGNASSVADIGSALADIGKVFSELVTMISWFWVPSHWIRIISFLVGAPLVGIGVVTMTVGTRPIPISGYGVSTEISGGSIAPAIGILEVTVGAVLLFVAFHALPEEVKTFPEFLGYLQAKAGAGASSKLGPGPHVTVD